MSKLIEFANRSQFDAIQDKSSMYRSIVFIKDTKEIWTHGTFYTGENFIYESKTHNLSSNFTTFCPLVLNGAGTYVIQLYYGGVYYSGIFAYSNYVGDSQPQNFDGQEIPLQCSGNRWNNGIGSAYPYLYAKVALAQVDQGNGTTKWREVLQLAGGGATLPQEVTINMKIKKFI